jgi:hypothetical protein
VSNSEVVFFVTTAPTQRLNVIDIQLASMEHEV